MSRTLSISALSILTALIASTTTVHAATISFVGQTFANDQVEQWRTTSLPKPLDLDGDDIFGSAGYIAFATSPVGSGFADAFPPANGIFTASGAGPRPSNPSGLTTLMSLPQGMTVQDGWLRLNALIGAGFYGTIDSPLGGDNAVGFAERAFTPDPNVTAGNNIEFTIGSDTPGVGNPDATMRIGVMPVNDLVNVADFVRVQSTTSNTGFIENFQGDFGKTLMFFDVTDYAAGDKVEIWLQPRSDKNRVGLTGITFDVVIPEPGSLALLSLGAGLLLRRRCR